MLMGNLYTLRELTLMVGRGSLHVSRQPSETWLMQWLGCVGGTYPGSVKPSLGRAIIPLGGFEQSCVRSDSSPPACRLRFHTSSLSPLRMHLPDPYLTGKVGLIRNPGREFFAPQMDTSGRTSYCGRIGKHGGTGRMRYRWPVTLYCQSASRWGDLPR